MLLIENPNAGFTGIAIAGIIYVAIALGMLHFLRRDLSVISSPISEYAIGRHGRLMTSVLWVWAIASVALVCALLQRLPFSTYLIVASILLVIFATGLIIAAVFRMDVPFPPERMHPSAFSHCGLIHISSASVATMCFPVAAVLLSWAIRDHNPQFGHATLVVAMSSVTITSGFFAISLASIRYFGIAQRSLVCTDLLWLFIVAIVLLLT